MPLHLSHAARGPGLRPWSGGYRTGDLHSQFDVPPTLEVSGDGVEDTTLDTAGDTVEFTIGTRNRSPQESGRAPAMGTAPPLRPPTIPGLPPVTTPAPESQPAAGPGTRVRISLGDVRQAALGHSIAARAGAIRIAIDETGTQQYDDRTTTLLDLEMGFLESPAVAPEPTGGGVAGTRRAASRARVAGCR